MKRSHRLLLLCALLALLGAAGYRWLLANPGNLGPRELAESAARGYLFGYPLVLMDESARSAGTDVPGSAVNALRHVREFPGAGFRAVVRPNLDTLYSIAWLDLSAGPLLLTLPPIPDRFYQFPVLDGWTNVVASPGSRTLAGRPGRFLIVGPGWSGEVPAGADDAALVAVPTRIAWLLGRIHARGEADFPAVHALQDQVQLAPLANAGGAAANPWPAAAAASDVAGDLPPDRVAALSALAFFQRLGALLVDNPAAPSDREALAALARLGVEPGIGPDPDAYGWLARRLLERGVAEVRTRLAAAVAPVAAEVPPGTLWEARPRADGSGNAGAGRPGESTGWRLVVDGIGRYGTDYRLRAGVALIGFGANLPEDAVYPTTDRDGNGDPLSGGRAYRLHFPPGELPPARAFWSLTVYDGAGYLLPGVGGRHRLGSSDALQRDADGGLTLYLQPEAPAGDARANWLPLPSSGPVQLTLRLYEPGGEVLAGRWQPPAVMPAEGRAGDL